MPTMKNRGKTDGPLSPTQHRILQHLADGDNTEETRQKLCYKDIRTINDHTWLSRKKLGIKTTWELMATYGRYTELRRLEGELRDQVRRLTKNAAGNAAVTMTAQHLESLADSYRYQAFEIIPPMVTPKCVHGQMITVERCRVCQMNRTKEHTFQGVKVTDAYDNISAMRCTFCSEIRSKAAHRSVQALQSADVELPEGVDHGTLEAYRKYKCRCIPCAREQSRYMAEWRVMDKRRRLARNNGLA